MTEKEFSDARAAVLSADGLMRQGIGTLGEKTLHRILKTAVCPDPRCHEIPLSGSVADVFSSGEISEIQTRSFERLRPKLEKFLPEYPVTIYYPIAHVKYIRWIDSSTGEMSERRKSPKTGTFHDAFFELYKLRDFLSHPNLRVALLLLNVDEYRLKNGWDKTGKRGSERAERIPTLLKGSALLASAEDYKDTFLPPLSSPFTVKEYAAATRLKRRYAYCGIRILMSVGVLSCVGKRGRENLYACRADAPENLSESDRNFHLGNNKRAECS